MLQMRQVTGPDHDAADLWAFGGEGLQAFFLRRQRWCRGSSSRMRSRSAFRAERGRYVFVHRFDRSRAEEEADLIRRVAEIEAGLFLGWARARRSRKSSWTSTVSKLDTKLMLGVGAAFDMHTGRIKDAPYWMKLTGCAVDSPHLSGSSAAVEALFREQSEVRLSDHAGVAGYSESSRKFSNTKSVHLDTAAGTAAPPN